MTKERWWEPEEIKEPFVPSETDQLIDRCVSMLSELKQIHRFRDALKRVGVDFCNVNGIKRDAVYGRVIGVWLAKRDYSTKQKGHPSDYRQFDRPISMSESTERKLYS